jgi:hypothetical protein
VNADPFEPHFRHSRKKLKKRGAPAEQKECRHCLTEKPAAEFPRNPRTADGFSSWCSACHVEATRASRDRRREAEEEATRKRREAHSAELRRDWEAWQARIAKLKGKAAA